jgi:hypothetical protein
MKQRVVKAISLSFVIVFMLAATGLSAQEQTSNLESIVIQSFDDPEAQPWFVIGSKFATAGYPKVAYPKTWPIAVFGLNPANPELRSLGVAMLFDRKGYNWVDMIPGSKSGEGDGVSYDPIELPLPGRVRQLDMWIWSGNYNFYMEVFVRDYKGIVHTLRIGDMNHVGWKNFKVNVPSIIPQSKRYLPKTENLKLVKIRIWTQPTEVAAAPVRAEAPAHEKAIYFYFDQLKILTDTFEVMFDGDSLTDSKLIEELWGGNSSN